MGILERTKHVIRADLNELLKKARNPRVVLDAYLEDLEAVLDEALGIRDAEEAERSLYAARLRDLKSVMSTLQQKARTCLANGDEELARTALERKLDLEEEEEDLKKEYDQREQSLEILDESLHGLKARISEVNRRRRELRFRRQILEARSELQETMNRVGHDRDDPLLSQAHDELTDMESRLEAEETVRQQDVDNRVLRMEAKARRRQREKAIDEELSTLRRQMKTRKKN